MIYRGYCNIRGVILVEILIAFSLAIIFIAVISESSQGARDIFTYAKERNRLIDTYEAGQFTDATQPYGNDRLQEIMAVSGGLQYRVKE